MLKHIILILFSGVFICMISAQDEQRLSLIQILDSAKHKHPALQRQQLKINATGHQKDGILHFSPAEITFNRGNLYSASKDYSLEFRQDFGSVFARFQRNRIHSLQKEIYTAENELQEKTIFSEIKMAYFTCQYYLELAKVHRNEYNFLLKVYNLYILEDSMLSSDKLDLLMISSALAEAEMNNKTNYNNIIKAQNQLLRISFLENETLPPDTTFEIYEITAPTDKTNRTPAHLFNNIGDLNYKNTYLNYQLSKTSFAPSIFAGYSVNTINNQRGFNYWTLGVRVPVFAFAQADQLKNARIQMKMAELEQYEQRAEYDAITANLLTEMNLYFERLNYFYDVSLEQSQNMLEIAEEQMNSGNYTMEKLLWAINKAFSIRKEYLKNVLNYNLKASELELYAY